MIGKRLFIALILLMPLAAHAAIDSAVPPSRCKIETVIEKTPEYCQTNTIGSKPHNLRI